MSTTNYYPVYSTDEFQIPNRLIHINGKYDISLKLNESNGRKKQNKAAVVLT